MRSKDELMSLLYPENMTATERRVQASCKSRGYRFFGRLGKIYPQHVKCFKGMIHRCKFHPAYSNVDIDDIYLCEDGIINFMLELGDVPKTGKYGIGRINHSEGYEPGNIKWELTIDNIKERNTRHNSLQDTYTHKRFCFITEQAKEIPIGHSISYREFKQKLNIRNDSASKTLRKLEENHNISFKRVGDNGMPITLVRVS